MSDFWMVRAGEGGVHAAAFEQEGFVAIGFCDCGDFTECTTIESLRDRINAAFSLRPAGTRNNYTGQSNRFRNVMAPGDRVITYDGATQEYLLGTLTGDYEYRPDILPNFAHVRRAEWSGRVSKKVLAPSSKATLQSVLTIFNPGERVLRDIEDALRTGRKEAPPALAAAETDFEELDDLFTQFLSAYLSKDIGRDHAERYKRCTEEGRRNFAAIQAKARAGEDVTSLVLSRLLPHVDSKAHRSGGDWIHVAPAINKDVQSWYEGAGWARPEDWPSKALLILELVEACTADPASIGPACAAFAQSPQSKGFQGGMITPILNAQHPNRLAIINKEVAATIERLTGDSLTTGIASYPESNAVVLGYVAENIATFQRALEDGVEPLAAFDMMCHWLVAVRESDDEESETEAPMGESTRVRSTSGRNNPDVARRVIEGLCPDAAPRATLLHEFANAIRRYHQLSPSGWSVTLLDRLVRLNTGNILAFDIARHGVYVFVIPDPSDVESLIPLESFRQEETLRSVEDAVLFLLPYDQLQPALSLLARGFDAYLRRMAERSSKATFRDAHSPGVLAYLRTVGQEVPDPAYASWKEPKPEAGKTSEPPPPPYSDRHPVFTAEHAAAETGIPVSAFDRWAKAINRKGQAILYGPPGTGKTYVAERLRRMLISGGHGHSDLVQFHSAYSYEDFIQGIRPQTSNTGGLTYATVPGRFMQFCNEASKREGTSVLIIDEINRANLSQVLGELMYLLEYRDRDLPLAGGERLRIPPSVRIIGTMNTADRSIALVDHALRRRFAFLRLDPDMSVLLRFHEAKGRDVSGLTSVLEELNRRIGDPHYSVGISFFMRESLPDDLEAIWSGEIEPYIEELFFDRKGEVDRFRWDAVRDRIAM